MRKSTSPCVLAIPAFDRIAGLYNRPLNSNRGICLGAEKRIENLGQEGYRSLEKALFNAGCPSQSQAKVLTGGRKLARCASRRPPVSHSCV